MMTSMEMAQFPILTAILMSTIVGMLVILFIPGDRTRLIKQVSLSFAGLGLVLCLWLYYAYDVQKGGLQFVERYLWVESLGIYYFNAVDGINLPMLLLTSIVLFTGVWTMWDLELRVKEFFALTYLLVAGVYGVFMSMDLFWIFVWYDVSLFPMYPLIAIWGGTRKEYGAMKLTLYLLAGSALILPGILYLWAQGEATPSTCSNSRPWDSVRLSRKWPSSCSTWVSAFLPPPGRSTHGRPWATWPLPPR